MALLRTFIALETPPAQRELLGQIQAKLKASSADVKWEGEDKFHTTVKFIGDTKEEALPRIGLILRKEAEATPPFSLTYDTAGFFPNWHNPKVVWVGCQSHPPAVSQLKNRIEKGLAQMRFPVETRPFYPHITMGRIKGEKDLKHLLSIVENLTFEPITIPMDEIILMKSILRPEGSQYFILEKFGFHSQTT